MFISSWKNTAIENMKICLTFRNWRDCEIAKNKCDCTNILLMQSTARDVAQTITSTLSKLSDRIADMTSVGDPPVNIRLGKMTLGVRKIPSCVPQQPVVMTLGKIPLMWGRYSDVYPDNPDCCCHDTGQDTLMWVTYSDVYPDNPDCSFHDTGQDTLDVRKILRCVPRQPWLQLSRHWAR